MSSRLVLLSDHRSHAQRLMRVLAARGIIVEATVLRSEGVAPLRAGLKKWAASVVWAARRRLAIERREKAFYAPLGGRVHVGGAINGARMIALLERLAPDYIIVGTSVILSPALIETAKCGVLNVHPGLLPWMRGSGVVGNALQNGVAIGATLHFIDAGIDTGNIVERRLLPVSEANSTLPELEARADDLGARILVDCIQRIVQSGEKPASTTQNTRFPLFKWAYGAGRGAQSQLAQAGRARELFESWQGSSCGAPDYVLPPDLMEAPRDVS